nr:immunoglobulin light chain junction region [Macaca mulatta]MOV61026.1 immunoglobulin light chain junction region [Macaca mulatta]MOV61036.1 immunoglobulin light chain junction region [Macaca mulatta]MOV61080.1 immunoglobulin light chain junction region [Macaca mulatta]MOV61121.1 immunoglobulin light chain junction region [Macaca mulatta]
CQQSSYWPHLTF